MRPLLLLARWACILVVSFVTAFVLMHFGRRTAWFKEHLYHRLISGDADERLHAASVLASVGAEQQLLRGLKQPQPEVHAMAQRALEHMWFYSFGPEAFQEMQAAHDAAEREESEEALRILDGLTRKFPAYAEGWNQRASVLWKLGRFTESKADCRRALLLNPNHYGAWQGLGVCQLKMGDLDEACRALRAALKILPYDDATQRSLRQCEQLLRSQPGDARDQIPTQLL